MPELGFLLFYGVVWVMDGVLSVVFDERWSFQGEGFIRKMLREWFLFISLSLFSLDQVFGSN